MNSPHHCPKCQSDIIGYLDMSFDADNKKRIIAHGYCHVCGSHFKEHYLTEYQGSEVYEYDPWDGPMSAPVTFSTPEEQPDKGESEEPHCD